VLGRAVVGGSLGATLLASVAEPMADQDDVRRIALSLPGAHEDPNRFAFTVENKGKHKGFAWVWLERLEPKRPRVPNPGVLAVRVRNEADKAMLLAGDSERFFTEPHYDGFPAVLVRLRAVTRPQLRKLLADAWRCQAPRALVAGAAAAGARPASRRGRAAHGARTPRR
jgi:hypothetical protein